MVDDGYLVGYEDGSGNFVEVGRFNNTSENVSDPLIIQHSDSGQSIELGPDGFSTESVSTEQIDSDIGNSGYSWQQVRGSRSFDTWYQAPSGRDIWVSVNAIASSDNTTIQLIFDVNRTQTPNVVARPKAVVDDSGRLQLPAIRVPAGQYYRVRDFGDPGDYSVSIWAELR